MISVAMLLGARRLSADLYSSNAKSFRRPFCFLFFVFLFKLNLLSWSKVKRNAALRDHQSIVSPVNVGKETEWAIY